MPIELYDGEGDIIRMQLSAHIEVTNNSYAMLGISCIPQKQMTFPTRIIRNTKQERKSFMSAFNVRYNPRPLKYAQALFLSDLGLFRTPSCFSVDNPGGGVPRT